MQRPLTYTLFTFLVLATLLVSPAYAEDSGQIILQDDFEDYTPEERPIWDPHVLEIFPGYEASLSTEESQSGTQSVRLDPAPASQADNTGAFLFASFPAETRSVRLTFWVWSATAKRALIVELGGVQLDPEQPNFSRAVVGDGGVSLYLHDGTIQAYADRWVQTGYTYPTHQWFHVRVDADIQTQEYTVYVEKDNGWQQIGVMPFRNPVEYFDYVLFTNWELQPRSSLIYIDDVVLSTF